MVSMEDVNKDIIQNRGAYREAFAKRQREAEAARPSQTGRQSPIDIYEPSQDTGLYCFTYDKKLMNEAMGEMMCAGSYRLEMLERERACRKDAYTEGSRHDLLTDAAGMAYAYSSLYQEIVRGYQDGTRVRYIYDKDSGGTRRATLEDELALLDKDYEYMAEMEIFAISSQMHAQETARFFGRPFIEERFDRQQVDGYIRDVHARIRGCCKEQYGGSGTIDMSVLRQIVDGAFRSDKALYGYCSSLIAQIGYVGERS